MKSFVVLAMLSFLLTACGGSDDTKTTTKTITIVNGDPIVIAKSTYTNTVLPTVSDFKEMISTSKHVQHDVFRDQSTETANKHNHAINNVSTVADSHSEEVLSEKEFTFEIDADQSKARLLIDSNYNQYFHFDIDGNNHLVYYGFGYKEGTYSNIIEDKIIHFSHHKETNTFSILHYYTYNSKEQKRIVKKLSNYTFTTSKPQLNSGANKKSSKFLTANNIKHSSPNISVYGCGLNKETDFYFSNAVKDWNSSGVVNINYQNTNSYPPFSDLNKKCIYSVDNYTTRTSKEVNGGFTINSYNQDSFIDSDIIILEAEMKKFENPSYTPAEIIQLHQVVATHELGHLLGLGHKFEKDPYISIMNYGQEEYKGLTKYDKETLAELYKDTGINP